MCVCVCVYVFVCDTYVIQGSVLRGEQSDATLKAMDSSATKEPDNASMHTPSRAPALSQDAHSRRRYAETLLDLQSRLLRAATRLERERSSQEERHSETMQRWKDDIINHLDTADREAIQLDSRTQRMLALQEDWKEEAERGEAAAQMLKQARRDLKEAELQLDELRSKEETASMRLLQADERNRELENQLRSAERTREELLSLQDDLRREATDVQLKLQDARDRAEESTRELEYFRTASQTSRDQLQKSTQDHSRVRAEMEERLEELTDQVRECGGKRTDHGCSGRCGAELLLAKRKGYGVQEVRWTAALGALQ